MMVCIGGAAVSNKAVVIRMPVLETLRIEAVGIGPHRRIMMSTVNIQQGERMSGTIKALPGKSPL